MTNPDLQRDFEPHQDETTDVCRALLMISADARSLVDAIADQIPAKTRHDARCAAVHRVVASLVREAIAPAATLEADLLGLLFAAEPH